MKGKSKKKVAKKMGSDWEFGGISDPFELALRPFSRKHTPHGEISHPWQIKRKNNK